MKKLAQDGTISVMRTWRFREHIMLSR